ncbi:MAG: hypothetical protein AABY22_26510 [Nanoarchaeota archaeon]
MKKILFLILFLGVGIKSYAYDDNFPSISSDAFASVDLSSGSTVVVPSTTTFSPNSVRQLNYANASSSSTIYFGTSPANAASLQSYGFPIFPLQSVSIDRNPFQVIQTSATTNTMYYFTRQAGSAEVGSVPLKVWIRYSE